MGLGLGEEGLAGFCEPLCRGVALFVLLELGCNVKFPLGLFFIVLTLRFVTFIIILDFYTEFIMSTR